MYTFSVILLLLGYSNIGLACNGYKLIMESITSCDRESILTSKNFNISIDENCMLQPKGCLIVTKPFKTAVGEYRVNKSPLPEIVGNLDICKIATTKNKKWGFLARMGLKCPMTAKTVCANGSTKMSLASFKNQMPLLLGKFGIMVTLEHDNGKSCLDIIAVIKK